MCKTPRPDTTTTMDASPLCSAVSSLELGSGGGTKGHVYVARLQHGAWYVGHSHRRVDERIGEHVTGNGAAWTKLHPIEQVTTTFEGDTWDELKTTVDLMREHGIHAVRGGPFCTVELNDEDHRQIQTLFDTTASTCFECHKAGHMARECPQRAARGIKRPRADDQQPREERAKKAARTDMDSEPFKAAVPFCIIM